MNFTTLGVSVTKSQSKLVDRIKEAVIIGWLGWVTTTLIDLKSTVAVLKYAKTGEIASVSIEPHHKSEPSLALPILPIPKMFDSKPKELKDVKK